MTAIAFIFARGGSKGLPRKNLQMLGGKPLLAWSIQVAKQCPEIRRVVVSTDDMEIAKVARLYGAEVPFLRPAELAKDNSPEWLSWQHAVSAIQGQSGQFETFISVPTTSPLRNSSDLSDAIRILNAGDCDAVLSITPANRNPYFNMVRISNSGHLEIVIKPESPVINRQTAPRLFDITAVVYAAKPDYIQSAKSLMEGRLKGLMIPKERAIDIDDDIDLRFAEFMIQTRQKK